MKKLFYTILATLLLQVNLYSQSDTPCGSGGGWGGGGGSGAEELTVGSSCSYTNGEITGGFMGGNTDSGEGDPGCGYYNGGPDVWYQFTVPASGSVLITTQAEGLTDMAMALYTGPDCNNLTQINCDDNGGDGTMPEIDAYGLTPGDVVWIRLWDYGGDDTGDFDICIVEETCSDGIWNQGEAGVDCGGSCTECTGDICDHSLPFCTGTTYNFPLQTDNGSAVSGPDYDCLYSQPNPVWYYLQISDPGDIDIHIQSTPGQHDVDFICWGPFDHVECDASDLTGSYVVDCSYSTSYQEDCNIPNAQTSEYYVLLITNYSNATTDVEFSQTGGDGATDCSIVEPPTCSLDVGQDQTICLGDVANVYANVSVDAGSTYSISWSPTMTSTGNNTYSVTPTATTTYTATLTTDNGCTVTDDITINTVELQIDQIVVTNDNCGFSSGTATVTMVNGQSPYGFDIGSQNNTDGNFTGLAEGTYQITVTDNMGCEDNDQFTIIDNGSVSAGFSMSENQCLTGNNFDFTNTGFTDPNATWDWTFQNANTTSSTDENPTGITWSNSGVFDVTQTVNYGTCQDVVTQQIEVFEEPVILSFTNIDNPCFGDCIGTSTPTVQGGTSPYTYFWTNQQTTSTATDLCVGNIAVEVTDANGCVAQDLTTINEAPELTIANVTTTDASCNGFSDGGITFTGNGGTLPYTYSNGVSTNNNGNFDNLTANIYNINITDDHGCSVNSSVTVGQPDELVITNIIKNDILCNGDGNGTVQINVQGGTTDYTYYLDSVPSTTGIYNSLQQGIYSVSVIDAHSCIATSNVEIVEPEILILSAQTEYNICNGSTVELTSSLIGGTPAYNYNWSTGDTQPNISVNPTDTTDYILQASDANGCHSNIVHVTVNPSIPVELDVIANNETVCPGDPVLLSTSINYGRPPFSVYVDDVLQTLPIVIYPDNSQISYEVKVEDACGSVDIENIDINTYPVPVINFSADVTQGCPPLDVKFTHDLSNISNFTWDFGDDNINSNSNPTHTYINSGIYDVSLSITTNDGCKSEQTVNNFINVYPTPRSRFIADPEVVSFIDGQINFDNISEGNDINIWDFGDGANSSINSPMHKFTNIGEYMVTLIVRNNYSCADTSKKTVIVQEEFTLYVPSAFSPDGDGINDEFKAVGNGIDLDNYSLKVYDRWGEVIFETTDLYHSWNGKGKMGKYVQSGTYRYLIVCKDNNGKEHTKTGNVNLIR